jgi:endonuclease G
MPTVLNVSLKGCLLLQTMKKTYRNIFGCLLLVLITNLSLAQATQRLIAVEKEVDELHAQWLLKLEELKGLKLEKMQDHYLLYGYPESPFKGEVVRHGALVLEYVEAHEQAAWVYHMILPDIIDGNEGRTNDFRIDSLVTTGSAIQEDYFTVSVDADGNNLYNGFGFDRGHLAPSADFRWNKTALSESYYYSNMSPQRAEFNREIWAELEDALRNYVYRTERPLWVITGGVLKSDLPKVPGSVNQVSIPDEFYKIAYDPGANQAIAFLIPNQKSFKTPRAYVQSVDAVEEVTGINFFPKMPNGEEVESVYNVEHWLPADSELDVKPLPAEKLPKNHFNSMQAAFHVNSGRNVTVCGTVVNSHFSRAGNVLLNMDKPYPDQNFTVFIKGEDLIHFSFSPDIEFKNECICATGKVEKLGDQPAMYVTKEAQLSTFKIDK